MPSFYSCKDIVVFLMFRYQYFVFIIRRLYVSLLMKNISDKYEYKDINDRYSLKIKIYSG